MQNSKGLSNINVEGFSFTWEIFFTTIKTSVYILQLRGRRLTPWSICPIYFSREKSSDKLISFLDLKLNTRSLKFLTRSRLETGYPKFSRVENWDLRIKCQGTVNFPLEPYCQYCMLWFKFIFGLIFNQDWLIFDNRNVSPNVK